MANTPATLSRPDRDGYTSAAELSDLLETHTGVMISPNKLQKFLLDHWEAVSYHAHVIHNKRDRQRNCNC